MTILDEKDNGTVTLTVDTTEEEKWQLIRCGMQDVIDREFNGVAIVVACKYIRPENIEGLSKWELTDDECQFYFERGFIAALKKGMEYFEKHKLP